MGLLDEIMTISEGAEIYQYLFINTKDPRKAASDDIRHKIHRNKFKQDEIRKSGREWVILKSAMIRLYGEPENFE